MSEQERALFQAYREWMLEDVGGADLADVITSWPGYREWAEENWS